MPQTTVVDAVGWKHVRNTYANITRKLKQAGTAQSKKLAAIDYWTARLQEDRWAIAKDEAPLDAPAEPED